MGRTSGILSMDDLWSVLGYLALIVLGTVTSREITLAGFSLLAAGMLAIFWLASAPVRNRNRLPNVRVVVWALIAAASAAVVATA